MRTLLVVVFLAGCSGPQTRSPTSDDPSRRDASVVPADAVRIGRTDCVYSAADEAACAARGSGYQYAPEPYVYCSGVAPQPETEQAEFRRIRTSPCSCNDIAAVAQRRAHCARMP